MSGSLALFAFSLWLIWTFYQDGKQKAAVSSAAWIVVIWAVIYISRPISEWVGGLEAGVFQSQSRDEGSPVDGFISLSLIVAGLIVLLRRGIRPSKVIRENVWLFVFYLFWLMSITWSDYPLITFKRVFKDLGNIVMVLIVLTDREPVQAIKAVAMRIAHLCIPLSIVLIRYYSELGRQYVGYSRDELMYVGVTTHKNSLGALAAVTAVFLLWDLLNRDRKFRDSVEKATFASSILVLAMCWYLLRVANSATALVCALLGSALLIVFSRPSVGGNPGRIEAIGLGGGIALAVLDSAFNLKEIILDSLGRDMTLTSRTDVWPILLKLQDSPIIGAGFNTFWSGHRLLQLPKDFKDMVQAHNGYIETYLNGGLIGVGLLAVLLVSAYWRIRKQLVLGVPEGTIRLVVLLMAILYNNSEASFTKVGLMWLVTVYAFMEYRMQSPQRQIVPLRAWSVDSRKDSAIVGAGGMP